GSVAEGGRNLSAGEIRRVLLTRAALSKPRLMLLDEPDDALDRDGPELVRTLVQGSDATTILITHNLEIARMMDVLWLVEDGRIVQTGTPDAILLDLGIGG
ncbi:MAG: ATP-binding cassette domain-containing protein, partial [Pseudomonadota bacterium]